MALNRYVHRVLSLSNYCYIEAKGNTDGDDGPAVSAEFCSVSASHQLQRDSVVRIVLAGGVVQVYETSVTARQVMEKHPGLCVTRTAVFRDPQRSVVGPEELLLPGEKFYLVPQSTVRKLQRKASNKGNRDGEDGDGKVDKGTTVESAGSANDFYISRWEWTEGFSKRIGKLEEEEEEQQQQQQQQQQQPQPKSFRQPIYCNVRKQHGMLLGWKPSLTTIQESSP